MVLMLQLPTGFQTDPILRRCELAMSADLLIYKKKASLIKGRFGGIVYMAGGIIADSASR